MKMLSQAVHFHTETKENYFLRNNHPRSLLLLGGIKTLQLGNHLIAPLDPGYGIVNELVHHSLGGLLFVHNGGTLAHEERAELLERVILLLVIRA